MEVLSVCLDTCRELVVSALISSFLIVAQDRSASQCFWELCAYLDSYLLDFGLNKQIFADWGEDGPVDDTPNSPVASAVALRVAFRATQASASKDASREQTGLKSRSPPDACTRVVPLVSTHPYEGPSAALDGALRLLKKKKK